MVYLTTTPQRLTKKPFPWNFRRQTAIKDDRAALTELQTVRKQTHSMAMNEWRNIIMLYKLGEQSFGNFLPFILLNYWNLTDHHYAEIFLATGKPGELLRGTNLFLFLLLIDSISEYNEHFFSFFIVGLPPALLVFSFTISQAINRCWKCFDYLECDSNGQHHEKQGWIYWKASGAEMFDINPRTSQSCLKWQSSK